MNKFQTATLEKLTINGKELKIFNPRKLSNLGVKTDRLPFSIIILIEQILRNQDGKKFLERDIERIIGWNPKKSSDEEIPFMPTRVVLQDFTGVPSLVDLASLREALVKRGVDPGLINPTIPVDLIIDHSVQVDHYGDSDSLQINSAEEFRRNAERYKFLKWGQSSFKNLRVFPPGAGIIHQINLEYLSPLSHIAEGYCFPDTLVGTDSHTTMINGLGVLGWGVGGIEAESAMLNQPIFMKIPDVIGFKLTGKPPEGTTATDFVLRITEMLRKKGVVEKFVEFYGPGLDNLSLADRATVSNMSPEYGATMGYFPVDKETLHYLRFTGRSEEIVNQAETYFKALGLFRDEKTLEPEFSDVLHLDLSTLEPCIAGPKRPQDRIVLTHAKEAWQKALVAPAKDRGFEVQEKDISTVADVENQNFKLKHGSIVIAAITSCTNTSNPSLLITAGLLAKKAVELGLTTKKWVKTSLAPGSRVVTDYLEKSGLQDFLNQLGFYTVGYGCTTCIGNSGPLLTEIEQTIRQKNLVVCSILSGNRNFEGRIHADVKANYLASPPLVIAYAIAGTIDFDITRESLGKDKKGKDVFLKDIWPSSAEVVKVLANVTSSQYKSKYATIFDTSSSWKNINAKASSSYNWDEKSTYIQNPPFFDEVQPGEKRINDIKNARVLLKLGDSVTTDHISPAGNFNEKSPAGSYLIDNGIIKADFNTYGARRGNDRVMVRGTFANVRIKNQLAPGTEGGFTKLMPGSKVMSIYDASLQYKKDKTPLIVIAGAEYGTGSSRDWAAKGPYLLGVKAVIAVSFERIHRSNLIGMGVLPLQFKPGQNAESLKLTGEELYSITGLGNSIKPKAAITVKADDKSFEVICRLDTEIEIEYFRNGGILHTVLLDILSKAKSA